MKRAPRKARTGGGLGLVSKGAHRRDLKQFLQRLKELFCSLDGGKIDPAERSGGIPPGFGWTESEADYQKAQTAWLRGEDGSGRHRGADARRETDDSGKNERG